MSEEQGKRSWQEEIKVSSGELVDKIKELIREGNIRHIIIKNEEGKELIEFPLSLGIVGAALVPILAAVGAAAAFLTKCTLVVTKEEDMAEGDSDQEDSDQEVSDEK